MGPDAVHDLTRLARVALADGNDHEVVEDRFDGEVDVDDFWQRKAEEREEDALDGLAHPCVFLGGLPTMVAE